MATHLLLYMATDEEYHTIKLLSLNAIVVFSHC